MHRAFESFEGNAAGEKKPAPACPTAQSRDLLCLWVKIPVIFIIEFSSDIIWTCFQKIASSTIKLHLCTIDQSHHMQLIASREPLWAKLQVRWQLRSAHSRFWWPLRQPSDPIFSLSLSCWPLELTADCWSWPLRGQDPLWVISAHSNSPLLTVVCPSSSSMNAKHPVQWKWMQQLLSNTKLIQNHLSSEE